MFSETMAKYTLNYHDFCPKCFDDVQEEISERKKQAEQRGVELHIWSKKEIENFMLVPSVIQRTISKGIPQDVEPPAVNVINKFLIDAATKLRDETLDGIATEIHARSHPKLSLSTANKNAREKLDSYIKEGGSLIDLCSGKALVVALSNWSKEQYRVELSALRLAKNFRKEEIPHEMGMAVSTIENLCSFAELNTPS